jgi:hypothetical protein
MRVGQTTSTSCSQVATNGERKVGGREERGPNPRTVDGDGDACMRAYRRPSSRRTSSNHKTYGIQKGRYHLLYYNLIYFFSVGEL